MGFQSDFVYIEFEVKMSNHVFIIICEIIVKKCKM